MESLPLFTWDNCMAPALTKSGAPSNRREKIPEGTLCVVCDDLASGIHYSVASCNGCKTFFRRALVNKQTFTCQFSGECLVGKNVRCVCRSCRLKKCFESGMDPKAIQHDRDKIRYTKVLKRQKEELKALEEAEREKKMMKIKEEIGSPGDLDVFETPSTSRAFGSKVNMTLLPELDDNYAELDATLSELMRIEKKLVEVRNAYRYDDQISTIWNMYIGSRALLSSDDWLLSATEMTPMLFSLTERREPAPTGPYRCARITPWSLREWFQRDLTLMMEWVKLIPEGNNLCTSDKVTLQKNFALNFAVYQLTFYTKDTTVLGEYMPEQTTLEERLRNLKRPRTPPPPIPSLSSTGLSVGLTDLVNCLYKQPLAKRIKDEILQDEPTCSAYLRRLTEQASSLSSVGSPSTSFAMPTINSTFLMNNGLTPYSPYSDIVNQQGSSTAPLPPTMSSGLPGALSDILTSSLKAAHHITSPPSYNTLPSFPTGFWNALGNSPGTLTFPPSPMLTASPLITSSPLMVQSPLMAASPLMASLSLSLPQSLTSFLPPPLPLAPVVLEREKTPEIDVETLSMDGKSEGKGSHETPFRMPATVMRSGSLTGSTDMITTLNLMSMRSPDEPCSSSSIKELQRKEVERMSSVSPDEVQMVTARLAAKCNQQTIKDEPMTPGDVSQTSSKKSQKDEEQTTLEEEKEEEETPCDPTPEAQVMNRINYPDGTFIERDKEKPSNDELYGLMIEGVWKVFRRHDIDQETFVLYKMMVFFNTELTDRGDHKLSEEGVQFVRKMRQKMYMHLMLHLQRTRGVDGLKVFSNLLLLGSTVSRVRNALRNMFTMATIFVPTNDLVDQLIIKDDDEKPAPSAFRQVHPSY